MHFEKCAALGRAGLVFCVTLVAACGSDESDNGSSSSNSNTNSNPPCTTNADCGADAVCLFVGTSEAGCAPVCTGQVDECSANASCGGVGLLEVTVCKEEQTAEEKQDPEKQPRVPCSSDADCSALAPNAVCALWQNQRDCTIVCSAESDCDLPTVAGVTADFLMCDTDQGNTSRDVCVPDPACASNPMSCLDIGFP